MDDELREFVRHRARDRCEYCLIPQEATPYFRFHVEHIIARQHAGESDDEARLALACARCNAYKGPNLSSVDPSTGQIVLLFNLRQDRWEDHFFLDSGEVAGLTPTGRATVRLLNMNAENRVELRKEWYGGE
ncbi:MAG TPA: HNH endonuclease signature motif containing protein [Pirellulales bacterium]|nr:HNH endonuclease signature motif containing protein [Pirellulales bacterium]